MSRDMKAKNLFLRILPYFISFAGGFAIFFINDALVSHESLKGLILNIASGLLSIPIIFIFYEIINDLCTRGVRNSMQEHLLFEINDAVVDLIRSLHALLNLSGSMNSESLEALLRHEKKSIRESLVATPEMAGKLGAARAKLLSFLHGNSNLSVLSDEQIRTLLAMVKTLGMLERELSCMTDSRGRETICDNVSEILKLIRAWNGLCEEDAIINHHSFQLYSEE